MPTKMLLKSKNDFMTKDLSTSPRNYMEVL
jgi:hypothetical protein